MSGKIATPKTTKLAQAKKNLAVSKAPVKKAPARKASAAKAAAPANRAAAKPATVTATAAPQQDKKIKKSKKSGSKVKVVRDSFTMPQSDYDKLGELKQLCIKSGMHVKKSELLRAGLHALGKLSAAQLKQAVSALEKIKTGRPKAN